MDTMLMLVEYALLAFLTVNNAHQLITLVSNVIKDMLLILRVQIAYFAQIQTFVQILAQSVLSLIPIINAILVYLAVPHAQVLSLVQLAFRLTILSITYTAILAF
jgi:hypothetical protein